MRLSLIVAAVCACGAWGQTVGVAGFMHESNSFNPALTREADFQIGGVERLTNEVAGYLDVLREKGAKAHIGMYANATPRGPVARDAYEKLTARMIASLKSGPKLDGILLALHGAMVAEHFPHGDEETLRRVREAFPGVPVAVTHDYHANVSPKTLEYCTALVTYQQNPHLDTMARGRLAASILVRTIRGEIRPVQAIARPPMIFNIVYQNTQAGVYAPITKDSMELEKSGKVLAASVPGGYQYADVRHVGPAAIVITDGDKALAEREAQRLSGRLWAVREQLRLSLLTPAEAVAGAMKASKLPVALMDTGDNIGGGSAGDATFILDELVKQKAVGWVVVMYDPEAVRAAVKAGVNGGFEMAVGGKSDKAHGAPVRVKGRVRSIDDGNYIEPEVRHGGNSFYRMGLTAVIEAEGSEARMKNYLVVTSERSSPNSIHQIVHLGIYPERQRILVAKGTIAPRAAYEPVSAEIVMVDSPGATAVNPARFTFVRAPADLFGLR